MCHGATHGKKWFATGTYGLFAVCMVNAHGGKEAYFDELPIYATKGVMIS